MHAHAGLVILDARYGPSERGDDAEGLDVDVTVPLQALVNASQLHIPGKRSKVRTPLPSPPLPARSGRPFYIPPPFLRTVRPPRHVWEFARVDKPKSAHARALLFLRPFALPARRGDVALPRRLYHSRRAAVASGHGGRPYVPGLPPAPSYPQAVYLSSLSAPKPD